MKTNPKIIWLASYPKSGNTWTRLFLHALKTGAAIQDLSELEATEGISSSASQLENCFGIDIDDIPNHLVQKHRSEAYKVWNKLLQQETIIKSHDTPFHDGLRIIPKAATKKVILLVRNPFDQVASYANHNSCSMQLALQALCNGSHKIAVSKRKFNKQVTQHVGSWSSFYLSWKNAMSDKLAVFRYEDLMENSFETFSRMVDFLDWDFTAEAIQKAIDDTKFDKIKKIEEEKGFKERPKNTSAFFRSGKVGNWRNEITQEMAEHLIDCHYQTLLELGYIDNQRNILI